ncbi:methyltransferase [Sodalis sp.]|uniref:methyltransferase n=1 Tax=Sodalis sp. (in: enterobacteria) TaxID=1898979 RepID=UPI003872CD4E
MSLFEPPFGAMRLERYPPGAANDTLQAWDAADEYLLQACPSAQAITGPTLIFNDAFGALACALQGRAPFCVSDSYLSQLATRHNLAQNTQGEQVTLLDSLAPLPPSPGLVLLKVPKTLALLEQQLHAVRQVAGPDTLFLAAGRVREIHRSTLALFSDIIGPTHTSLAQKKARLIYSTLAEQAPLSPPTPCIWPLEHTPYRIHNHANVFSRTSLDIGARFFLSYLPQEVEGTLVDRGCGNGILGLMALTANPRAEIHFVDESYMAIASSRLNISENRPADLPRCRFQVDNGLAGVAADSVQAIVCNPPFHQQQAITYHIARQMFRDARRSLQQGGELRIVANRHLDYFRQLKRLFGNCQALGANQKFVVLKSVKTRQGR